MNYHVETPEDFQYATLPQLQADLLTAQREEARLNKVIPTSREQSQELEAIYASVLERIEATQAEIKTR